MGAISIHKDIVPRFTLEGEDFVVIGKSEDKFFFVWTEVSCSTLLLSFATLIKSLVEVIVPSPN